MATVQMVYWETNINNTNEKKGQKTENKIVSEY